ncbi:MAG: 3'-5' exonuclease, partial [Promethearchaeota archaeon]
MIYLLDANYQTFPNENRSEINLFGIDQKGKRIVITDKNFLPFLYIRYKRGLKEKLRKNKLVFKIEEVEKILDLDKEKFYKVYSTMPQNLSKIRDAIKRKAECYEYSINFYKKYLIDKRIYPLTWIHSNKTQPYPLEKLKILAFDLEVIDSKIIMISLADNHGLKKVLTGQEKTILQEFEKIIHQRDPDFLITFNGDMFDFEILRERADEHKLDLRLGRDDSPLRTVRRAHGSATRLNGRVHIDLFNFINNIIAPQLQAEAITLADVSKELLGKEKIELSLEEMIQLWKKRKTKIIEKYCLNDSILTLELAKLLLPQLFE